MVSIIRLPVRALVVAVLLLLLYGFPSPTAARIGVLPLRVAPGINSPFASEANLAGLTDAIVQDLKDANIGEVTALAWPPDMPADEKPRFETLVGAGREAGCTGVVVLTVNQIGFTANETRLPIIGTIRQGKSQVVLTGGLVDVPEAKAVAPVDATSKQDQKRLEGPTPDDIAGETIGSDKVAGSLLGKALAAEKEANIDPRDIARAAQAVLDERGERHTETNILTPGTTPPGESAATAPSPSPETRSSRPFAPGFPGSPLLPSRPPRGSRRRMESASVMTSSRFRTSSDWTGVGPSPWSTGVRTRRSSPSGCSSRARAWWWA